MSEQYLYVQDAARLAGCSTKTLYRRMNRGDLAYTTGEDQRRLIRALDVIALVDPKDTQDAANRDPLMLERLERIEQKLNHLLCMQEKLLSLYEPQSMATLADKHTR